MACIHCALVQGYLPVLVVPVLLGRHLGLGLASEGIVLWKLSGWFLRGKGANLAPALVALISCTLFFFNSDQHTCTFAKCPTLNSVTFFTGHCSQEWGPQPQFLQACSLLEPVLEVGRWFPWHWYLFGTLMEYTSVFISWSCLSADSPDFAISWTSLKVGAFPTLNQSFQTQSEFIPSTRKSLTNRSLLLTE